MSRTPMFFTIEANSIRDLNAFYLQISQHFFHVNHPEPSIFYGELNSIKHSVQIEPSFLSIKIMRMLENVQLFLSHFLVLIFFLLVM